MSGADQGTQAPDKVIIQKAETLAKDEQAGASADKIAQEQQDLAATLKANPLAARQAIIEEAAATAVDKGDSKASPDRAALEAKALNDMVKAAPDQAKEDAGWLQSHKPVVDASNPDPAVKAKADTYDQATALINDDLKGTQAKLRPDVAMVQKAETIIRDQQAGASAEQLAAERKDLADLAKANPEFAKNAIFQVAGATVNTPEGTPTRDRDAKVLSEIVTAAPEQAKDVVKTMEQVRPDAVGQGVQEKVQKLDAGIALINADLAKGETPDGGLPQKDATPPAAEKPTLTAPTKTLQTLEGKIEQAVEKMTTATNEQDKSAALKELNRDVAMAPEAARYLIKDSDTTKMTAAQQEAIVAVRDALQKSDAANIRSAAANGNGQEVKRLASKDQDAVGLAVNGLKGPDAEALTAQIQAALKGSGIKPQSGQDVQQTSPPRGMRVNTTQAGLIRT